MSMKVNFKLSFFKKWSFSFFNVEVILDLFPSTRKAAVL